MTATGAGMPRKVLVVEDDPNILISLEFLLREAGHEVVVARDGAEGLRLALAERPELVILDVMLPSVNGFEVCRQLRGSTAMRGTRILMLTARGRETEVARGKAAGADAYVTKPFSTKDLVGTVARLLKE